VVLAGARGDELFCSYPWRYYRAAANDDFEHYIDRYYLYWQTLIPNKTIHKVFRPVWNEVKHVWTRDIFRDVFQKNTVSLSPPEGYINQSLYFESKTVLHGLLVVGDKLSMAHSLETRVPFLDNDLVDFALQVPVTLKLRNLEEVARICEKEPNKLRKYFEQTGDGKLILRKVMQRYVPKEITGAIKQGFSAPDAS
jgi:asparagine synthase (glutamine-hydrolysing)